MPRRERPTPPPASRWPWVALGLALLALWGGFRWTSQLLYPGPGRPPGETIRFAEPREGASGGEPEAAPARPGTEKLKPPVQAIVPETAPAAVGAKPVTGSPGGPGQVAADVPSTQATAVPVAASSPRPRPAHAPSPFARTAIRKSRPRESFDDLDRRTLEAILERRSHPASKTAP